MAHDLFSQLAESDVPPAPAELDSCFSQRLNTVLLAAHLFEFAVRAFPQVLGVFLESVLHLIAFSITGRMQSDRDDTPSIP